MHTEIYSHPAWRALPRTACLVENLFGEAAGPCSGLIHRHHVDPADPHSRTIEVCAGHHNTVHKALRALLAASDAEVGCPHRPGTHRYPHAREECARRHREAAMRMRTAA